MAEKVQGLIHWIANLIFWLVIFVCLAATSIVFFTGNRSSYNFRLFGIVQSRSMEASGLEIGDAVRVNREKQYEIGDIIVFFRMPSVYDQKAEDIDFEDAWIWIHEVVDIGKDAMGRRTYLTKGSSNVYHDMAYVPEDFVLGKAEAVPELINKIVQFLMTAWGIILLIVLPSGVLFVTFTIDFVMLILEKAAEEQERLEIQRALEIKPEEKQVAPFAIGKPIYAPCEPKLEYDTDFPRVDEFVAPKDGWYLLVRMKFHKGKNNTPLRTSNGAIVAQTTKN